MPLFMYEIVRIEDHQSRSRRLDPRVRADARAASSSGSRSARYGDDGASTILRLPLAMLATVQIVMARAGPVDAAALQEQSST